MNEEMRWLPHAFPVMGYADDTLSSSHLLFISFELSMCKCNCVYSNTYMYIYIFVEYQGKFNVFLIYLGTGFLYKYI